MESATCIAAIAHEGKVWIGGDSAATDATTGDRLILSNKKVFSITDTNQNKWLVGFSGAYRFGQLLQFELKLQELPHDEEDILGFMVRKFIPALHTCLHDHSFEQTDKSRALGGNCMVCVKGRIFIVTNQYSLQESIKPYNAIGCGAPTALGSLFSTDYLLPEERIQVALEAAEQFNTGVAGPFTIIHS